MSGKQTLIGDDVDLHGERGIAKLEQKVEQLERANRLLQKQLGEDDKLRTVLRESEARYRILADASPVGVYLIQDGVLQYVNQCLIDATGYSADELIGKMTPLDLVAESSHPLMIEQMRKRLAGEQALDCYTCQGLTKQGEIVDFEVHGAVVMHQGKPALTGSLLDITERKRAEAALKASEARLNSIFQASQDSIVVHQDFKVVFANEAALRLSGVNKLEYIIGSDVLNLVAPDYRSFAGKVVKRVISSGKLVPARELAAMSASGKVFPIEISSSPILWKGAPAVVSIIRDISARKQVEAELEKHRNHLEELVEQRTAELARANAHLQELDHLKSMFIASMSHELRTPMNSILGFSDLILGGMTGEINDTQRDMLMRVKRSGKHLLMLITDVIDLSKVEAGKINAQPVDFDLGDVLNEALQDNTLEAEKKGIIIDVDLPAEPIQIYSDRHRLFQCVLNLTSNAVKYSKQGVVTLSARQAGDDVIIAVQDSGIGMSADEAGRLFKPFVRLDSELTVKAGGTGLGLYLTQKLMQEVLGGTVSVESCPGEGSCFTLRLPCVLAADIKPSDTGE